MSSRLRVDEGAPELLLSPHWDDAVLSCWNLLSSGRELNVVNVFAGVPAAGRSGLWERVAHVADSAERARVRMREDALALSGAGRTAVNLALLDAQYRASTAGLDDLDGVLGAEIAGASRVYVPAAIGGHRDHLLVRSYGLMLLRLGMPVTLYADLPYCIFHGWPSWVDGSAPVANRDVDAYWAWFLRDLPEHAVLQSAEVDRLDEPTAQGKLAAIRCYETSLNHSARQLLADPALHGFEVRWTLAGPGLHGSPPPKPDSAHG